MRTLFGIVNGVIMLLLAYGYPFVAGLRARPIMPVVMRVWLGFLGYMVFICFGLPGIVGLFNESLSREMLNKWVPEGPAVVAVAVLGWSAALIPFLIGKLVRRMLQTYRPLLLARIDSKTVVSNDMAKKGEVSSGH